MEKHGGQKRIFFEKIKFSFHDVACSMQLYLQMNKKNNIRNSKKCCLSTLLPQFHSPTHDKHQFPAQYRGKRQGWQWKGKTGSTKNRQTWQPWPLPRWSILQKIDAQISWSKCGRYGAGPQSQGDGEKKIYWTKERFAPREDLRNASRSEKKGRRTRRSLGRWGGIGTKSTEQYLLNRSHLCERKKAEKIPPPLFATTAKRIFMGWNVRISMFVDLEELKNE